ncbi:50S ribosomal protein L5 [Patescibacteria group bacterium]|nr:50S ribosomal protein L5 [Patescibacteria group bacterium]
MSRLRKQYNKTVVKDLQKELSIANVMSVPKIEKVVVTIGTGKALKDAKFLDTMIENLRRITGLQPVKTRAKESISNFGIREGMTVGLQVTLRKEKMYDFVDKLVNITLPRVRDFQGLSTSSFDGKGSYTIGFKEHVVFPEIKSSDVARIHGLGVTISTTASSKEETYALLKALGFPFKKEDRE